MNKNNTTIKYLKIFSIQIKLIKLGISALYIFTRLFEISDNKSKEEIINSIIIHSKKLCGNEINDAIKIIEDSLLFIKLIMMKKLTKIYT